MALPPCRGELEGGRRRKKSDARKGIERGGIGESQNQRIHSVFECHLTEANYRELRKRVRRVVKEEDSVRFYRLCRMCQMRIEVEGKAVVTEEPKLWII